METQLKTREFHLFRQLAYDYCGLAIEDGKELLVASRLLKLMRELRIPSFSAYYDYVVSDPSATALVAMVDSLTTNYTQFFREPKHFAFLSSVVYPALAERAHFSIWSAACSTGEEPYSLAISALEHYGGPSPQVRILATDISTRVLALARQAIYKGELFSQFPLELRRRYLLKGTGAAEHRYQFRREVRDMIEFERFNLTKPFGEIARTYPLILCRNVMIYFDLPTQERLIAQFTDHLEPGGYLFVGHAESLNTLKHKLEYVQPAIYRRSGALAKH